MTYRYPYCRYYRRRLSAREAAAMAGVGLLLAVGASQAAATVTHHHPATLDASPAASATYLAAEHAWEHAGGAPRLAPVMAAIGMAESGLRGVIQQGQPYATTGWGPWQITPGDSEPQCGTDAALLSLAANACAAVAKERSQGLGAWTTWNDGAWRQFLRRA